MTERDQIYKCSICGNIVEVKHAGAGELACCGKSMIVLNANTEDAAIEKHVPQIESTEDGIVVRVGKVDHPMDNDHYIEWITLVAGNEVKTVYLTPNEEPVATFAVTAEEITVYAYCNLHGLWKSNM
ncbi:MAG: desulfoferrodoxin [Candidatus Moraniibacteriota bacterium]|nr:MAG: desulfoferrodoxin [Candidatus Moranbacteria bacterium]